MDGGDAVVLSDSRTEAGTFQAFGGGYLSDCLMVKNDFAKANPNTVQAIANGLMHAMQWLKTASIDDIMKSLPPAYYKSDEAWVDLKDPKFDIIYAPYTVDVRFPPPAR